VTSTTSLLFLRSFNVVFVIFHVGLGIWPASILLARWVTALGRDYFQNKVIVELGAGCGLPSLATATYCGAKSVYITDIHDPTLANAAFNLTLNGVLPKTPTDEKAIKEVVISVVQSDQECSTLTKVLKVNWKDPCTFPSEKADVLLGSDLVYDVKILDLLVPAIKEMLTAGTANCLFFFFLLLIDNQLSFVCLHCRWKLALCCSHHRERWNG
jgi:predicted nicotinamide N-methyase